MIDREKHGLQGACTSAPDGQGDRNGGQGTRLVLEEIHINNLTFLRVKAHSSERGKARNIVYNKWEVARARSRNCIEDGSIICILESTRPGGS